MVSDTQENVQGVIVLIKKLQVSTTIIIFALLLILLFYQSIDRYKSESKVLSDNLAELKASSKLLAVSDQQAISGKRIDYESLSEPKNGYSHNLSESVSDVNQDIDVGIAGSNNDLKEIKENIIFHEVMVSEIIAFELLHKLCFDYRDNKYFSKKINTLKAIALKEKKDNYKTDYSETIKSIKNIKSNDIESHQEFSMDIRYLMNSFISVGMSKKLFDEKKSKVLIISDNIKNKIYILEQNIKNNFNKERLYVIYPAIFFIFILAEIIFYSVYKIKCLKKLNSKRNRGKENNKKTIEGKEKVIVNEKIESENILKSLLVVQKRIFTLINNIEGCLYEYDLSTNKVSFISTGLEKIWGLTKDQVLGRDELRKSIYIEDRDQYYFSLKKAIDSSRTANIEYRINNNKGELVWVREIATPLISSGKPNKLACICYNITAFKEAGLEKEKMKKELAQAQKLESVGQLAAGIAHEINTPSQFISDNLTFLQEAVDEVLKLFQAIGERIDREDKSTLTDDLKTLINEVDMPYLVQEIPAALLQSYEGIISVSKIIRAMKDYSHPEKSFKLVNINMCIESTVLVSSSEWKYFSKIEKIFDDNLPLIECVASDINQVILNIIVNAAHSIEAKYNDCDHIEGKITVETIKMNGNVLIEITDNGNGMTEDERSKVFDHFFTTKEVGKGTGQGLSIAHRLIYEKHQGFIEVQSTPGVGSMFRITLPVIQPHDDLDKVIL
jgi:PAS domain S-box-containing protein